MTYSKLMPGAVMRANDEASISQRITEFRQGDFEYINETVMGSLFARSKRKRIPRDVPLVTSYARELAPHYDTPPKRVYLGAAGDAARVERAAAELGHEAMMRELAHRLVTQHTVLGVWLPIGSGEWSVVLLDPWEYEIDPHPQACRSLRRASEIRLRLPRRASHSLVEYDVATFRRSDNSARWRDGSPIYDGAGRLPVGEYPCFYGRLGDTPTGDFNGPLPRWLYSAQIAASLTLCDMEFQARYSGGQLVGYGLQKEAAQQMDWGPDGIATVDGTKQEVEIVNVERSFSPEGHVASHREFDAALRLTLGQRPRSFESHAVTAEAKLVELWDRQQARYDITAALQAAEGSWLRSARVALGWDFGAGDAPLAPMRVDCQFRLPSPPQNAYQRAQGWRLGFEDGIISPADIVVQLAAEQGQSLTREQAIAEVSRNLEEYLAMKAKIGPAAPQPGAGSDGA